jgi:uncharacterized protein (TIGR02444 family)
MIKNHRVLKTLPDHPFWKFSVKIYAMGEVESALIKLQNERGLNVNVILFCCWYSFRGQGRLGRLQIKKLLISIQLWHERIVLPWRRLREKLKNVSVPSWMPELRKEVLQLELIVEQIEQLMLADIFVYQSKPIRTSLQKVADMCKNIAMYCQMMQVCLEIIDCENIATILTAIFSKIDRADIIHYCNDIFIKEFRTTGRFSQLSLDL